MRYFILLTATLAALPTAALAETPAATEEAAAEAVDVSGYRLCPKCNTLNAPQAEFCMRCGADLGGGREEIKPLPPASVKAFAVTPFGFVGNYESAGGGVRARLDGLKRSYTASYAYDARWRQSPYYVDHEHHRLVNDGRFYFGGAAIRPFLGAGLDTDYYFYKYPYPPGYERETRYFVVFAALSGGLEFNYDRRGSFLDMAGFAGPAAYWYRGTEKDFETLTRFLFKVGNIVYFNQHVGLDAHLMVAGATGYYSPTYILFEAGPALGW
jgi:ribosomal protein L40E